jgi:molecular chaperone HtpG
MKKQVFVLYPTVDDKYFTLEELKENLKENKPIKMETSCFYAGNKEAQHSYIETAQEKRIRSIILTHLLSRT